MTRRAQDGLTMIEEAQSSHDNEERWPLAQAVAWIATRSFEVTERFRGSHVEWLDDYLLAFRTPQGNLPRGASAGEAFNQICAKLMNGELVGRATRVVMRYEIILAIQGFPRHRVVEGETAQPDLKFPPQDDRSLIGRLSPLPRSMDFKEKPAPDDTTGLEWRNVSLARSDVVGLWPTAVRFKHSPGPVAVVWGRGKSCAGPASDRARIFDA